MIEINELIKTALKEHNKSALLAYQSLKAAILNFKTAKNAKEYNDVEEVKIIQKLCKEREDSMKLYMNANRDDLCNSEYEELQALKKLLPEPVSTDEIYNKLESWCVDNNLYVNITKLSGNSIKLDIPKQEMKNAISYLKAAFPFADGRIISEIVKTYTK